MRNLLSGCLTGNEGKEAALTSTLDAPARVTTFRLVGQALPRPEDPDLVRGLARYVADLREPGCVEVVFMRSWAAHARLRGVDLTAARRAPGVLDAWSAADLPNLPDVPVPPTSQQPAEMARPTLARDRVRFVGEPVAMIVATDRYAGEDALELVDVELEELEALTAAVQAASPEAVRLFPPVSNVAASTEVGASASEAVAASPIVVETEVHNQRLAPMSLETRGILASPTPQGGLTVWCSHQAPHRLRDGLARSLGLDPALVRVAVPSVGGAYGAKSQVWAEYLAVCFAALRLSRPVRWVEDRYEAFVGASHGRGQTTRMRLGLLPDGTFQALEAEIWADVGAYPHTGALIPSLTAWVFSGPYRIPALHVRTHSVVTTTTPTAAYRGAGRPEAAYALERLVDVAAERLEMDPAELRRRNLLPEAAFPYRSPTGAVYDSARHHDALELALGAVDYPGWRAEQHRRRREGSRRQVGVGLASWVERTGGQRGGSEYARVEIGRDGRIVARIGTASQGQGHLITFAQVVAEALGVDPGQVRVLVGNTAEVAQGTGAFGSRSMQVGGNAAYLAAIDLKELAGRRAADLLGLSESELSTSAAGLTGPSGDTVSWAELAAAGEPLGAERVFAPPQAFSFGCYVAVVEVDTRTGTTHVLRLVAVDDCGTVVNPMVVEGQVLGSLMQGLGQALYEAVRYDENGNPTTTTMLDYTVPTASELPDLELLTMVTPNPNVPLGTKGAGESGCVGTPPAVANAVHDALAGHDRSGLHMPLTARAVWQCLQRPTAATTGPDGRPGP